MLPFSEPRPGPFHGVPFSIKDSIEVEGTVCSAGTLGYRNAPKSTRDATLVARLRAAGAVPIARTNLPDLLFAFESDNLMFGRTNNPYDYSRTSGGSSGGEAALIASCGSPFGLGIGCCWQRSTSGSLLRDCELETDFRKTRADRTCSSRGWMGRDALADWADGSACRGFAGFDADFAGRRTAQDHTVIPMPYEAFPFRICGLRISPTTDSRSRTRRRARSWKQAAKALGAVEMRPPGVELSYELEMKFLGADGGDGVREFLRSIGSFADAPVARWVARKTRRISHGCDRIRFLLGLN